MPEHTELPHTTPTPIQNRYSFWYKQKGVAKPSLGGEQGQRSKENSPEDYESSITELASFQTLENFWKVYNHINVRKQLRILALSRALRRPANLAVGSDLHLFREGIKPAWEDTNNCKGGHWTIRLKKGLTSHYWEELLFAIIGEMFDVGNEICGLSCCIRHGEDVVSVWNRSADRRDVCDKINEVIRKVLDLPQTAHMEYRRHDESLLNIPGGHGGHGGGRGDHHSRHPQTWPRNYVPGGRRRFDRKEPDGGLSAVNGGERSGAPQSHSNRLWDKNRRPNSNSGDSWDKDRDKGMNRWANVRRHNGSVDEPGGSTTSGSGPNSGPAGSSRSGHYGGSYDQGDDHIINRQLSGGERTRSGHNSSQCTERERDWSKLRTGAGSSASKTPSTARQATSEVAS